MSVFTLAESTATFGTAMTDGAPAVQSLVVHERNKLAR
jgi:hypothetical protein